MRHLRNSALQCYRQLYRFIAQERLRKGDLHPRHIHTHTVTVLTTGVLMWAYAVLAHLTIASAVPAIVGYVCSTIHLLSPLLFRVTNSAFLISNVMIGAGFVHQTVFSCYSGGFLGFCPKWYAILPLLAGFIAGFRGAITWAVITLVTSFGFLALHLAGYEFPYLISDTGYLVGNSFIQFGFILLCSSLIIVYVHLREESERFINRQNRKIDGLFRVLFHDLANPLGRVGIGIHLAQRQQNDPQTQRGLEIAADATQSMLQITHNVRRMYAVSKGQATLDLSLCALNEAVEYTQRTFAEELRKKRCILAYDFQQNHDLHVRVEPVSFKNQVLGNIVSNAIKFSNPGSAIAIRALHQGGEVFTIEIQDQGVGIPEGLLPYLFDTEKKTTRPGTNGEEGTGLGMHIMKSFVEMYEGKVSVESREGVGTTFRVSLNGERQPSRSH